MTQVLKIKGSWRRPRYRRRSALGIDACTLHTLTSLSVTWSEP